ncbi:MAG: 30S ribosomal protein S16 [Candidatus Neomarinimicrobiota bacterium]|nr:MAG: 30S ribosomal protein S16 [Candidatus Neomarinimicrobiota bacterium]
MAIKIRLKRIGRRNRPFYRVVVMDSRKRRDGAALEELGWFNPIALDKESNFRLKEDRILYWLGVGAQPTDPVRALMKRSGLSLRWHLQQQGLDEDSIRKEMEKWALNRENRKQKKPSRQTAPEPAPEVTEPAPSEEEQQELPDQEEAPTEPSEEAAAATEPEETPAAESEEDNTSEPSTPEPEAPAETEAESEAEPTASQDEGDQAQGQ